MKGEDLTLLEQTTQLTHTRLRTTGYTLESSLKNLPRRLNLQNGSWLYYKTLDCAKCCLLLSCNVPSHGCLTKRTLIIMSKWLFNTSTSTTLIVSPLICTWALTDVCEQWERKRRLVSADAREAETRDEPLRTFAWELRRPSSLVTFRQERRLCLNHRNQPDWWRKTCPESGQELRLVAFVAIFVLAMIYEPQTNDKSTQRSNVNAMNL